MITANESNQFAPSGNGTELNQMHKIVFVSQLLWSLENEEKHINISNQDWNTLI